MELDTIIVEIFSTLSPKIKNFDLYSAISPKYSYLWQAAAYLQES
jgi:hypothetical protein